MYLYGFGIYLVHRSLVSQSADNWGELLSSHFAANSNPLLPRVPEGLVGAAGKSSPQNSSSGAVYLI